MRQINSSIGSGHGPSGILLGSVGAGLVGFLRSTKPQRLVCKRKVKRKGFTLIEILIVVALCDVE